jgi:Mrp family chromosome partitioning ATPase/capsular polysaccharide biosynthesis protein
VVAVAGAFAYSKIATPKYQSSVLIEMAATNAGSGTGAGGTASLVTLPDPVQELSSTAVLLNAAQLLKDADLTSLSNSVTGTVDTTTGSLSIVATGSSPRQAQAIASAYGHAFVNQIQAIATAQYGKIGANLNQITAKIASLNAAGAAANAAEIALLQQTEATLLAEQFNITSGEPYASIQVAASLPTAPSGLTKSKLLGIGFLAGVLVGIGIALVREQFDTRLRTSSGAESITTAPILAELPADSDVRSGKVAIALVQAPQSQIAESIRELRTSLRVIFEDTPCPMIVVTSPEPGDGKTFVTANLATAWAMSGSKVIVVSAALRRPRLEEIFGLQATGLPGLADLIRFNWKNPERDILPVARRESTTDAAATVDHSASPSLRATPSRGSRLPSDEVEPSSVKSLLFETGIWGLQVLPAGTELDSPSELFGSPGMQPVLDQLPLLADVIVFDTPPVLPVPDTAILARMANGTVVVASEGRTDRNDLERTISRLESTQCRVLGVALNRVRRASSDSYQSYAFKQ